MAPVPNKPSVIYANVFGLRTTERELILDFGSFFPASEADAKGGVTDIQPDIRIVMPIDAVRTLADILGQLRDASKKVAS
jgi:hypothetical protein